MSFLATWGCANEFLKMLPKTLKLKVRNYSNSTITFPTIRRCAGDFFKVLLKIKMAATDQLQFFGGRKNLVPKLFKFYNHIPHDMEMSM